MLLCGSHPYSPVRYSHRLVSGYDEQREDRSIAGRAAVRKPYTISHAGIEAVVQRKRIRHIYVRVKAPEGTVVISAPEHVPEAQLRLCLERRNEWIIRAREEIRRRGFPGPEVSGKKETALLWGRVFRTGSAEAVQRNLQPDMDPEQRLLPAGREELKRLYRNELLKAAEPLIGKWEKILGVRVDQWSIRAMKTRWGSCSPGSRRIRLNLDLARRRPEFLEYVIVHELAHLLEPRHNADFYRIIARCLPDWKRLEGELKLLSASEPF
jgi:predicted metal-dependent hydrolase